jgi:glycosyltransferase involved in cell wall biosynthesis
MRILLAGPDHAEGSITPYLDVLADGLRGLGATVERIGTPGLPYDHATGQWWPASRIAGCARELAGSVDLARFDLVSVHYGNLEIEQLLPVFWAQPRPPVIHHVHALDWTLFTRHRPDPALRSAVETGLTHADALIFFGDYGRRELTRRLPASASCPGTVIPLPTTIPTGTPALATAAVHNALRAAEPDAILLTLYGFAAPWKDVTGLLEALDSTRARLHVVLAGPFWDDPQQAGCDLRPAVGTPIRLGGAARLAVLPEYLGPGARAALVSASHAGVFPYRPHPSFQGSGAIADYLANGVPVIATDVANFAELAGTAGLVAPPGRPGQIAAAMDAFARDDDHRAGLAATAASRSTVFTPATHAAACLDFYRTVTSAHPAR